MKNHIWVGRRDIQNPHRQYEINLIKKDWHPTDGWNYNVSQASLFRIGGPDYHDMLILAYNIVRITGIKLKLGEVKKIRWVI